MEGQSIISSKNFNDPEQLEFRKLICSMWELKRYRRIGPLPFLIEKGGIPQWIDTLTQRRDKLVKYLQANDIFCRRFWFPLHTHKPYRLPDNTFPNSTHLAAKAFWLPSSFFLSDTDIEQVCNHIRDFFG